MSYATILAANGLANAEAIAAAALAVGVDVSIAAAFVEQESGGANVYGHDAGGLNAGQAVTQANFVTFRAAVLAGHTSNGVGPMQITYSGYFSQNPSVAFWDPTTNIEFGLRIIKETLGQGLNAAAQLYNSGSTTGAPAYGSSVVSKASKWAKLLAAGTVTATSSTATAVVPGKLAVDGLWDRASVSPTTKALQTYLSTNPLYACTVDGLFGPQTCKALQHFVGVTQDGVFGAQTAAGLQRKINVTADGVFGVVSVRALQAWLNRRV